MIYGYARVSTKGQQRDGNSLESQTEQLKAAGCEVICSDSYTGTKMERPEFSALIEKLQPGDRLVVTKLDRFARNTAGGIELINALMERGIGVHILNMGLIDNTPTGRLIITIMLAFAQYERDMIVERTSTGKAIARENNPDYKEGRHEKVVSEDVLSEYREKIKKGDATVTECCKALGISRALWYSKYAA